MPTSDLQQAILNHTVLHLAGLAGAERREAAGARSQQLAGMIELARRLAVPESLHAFLEQHRDHLRRELDRIDG